VRAKKNQLDIVIKMITNNAKNTAILTNFASNDFPCNGSQMNIILKKIRNGSQKQAK